MKLAPTKDTLKIATEVIDKVFPGKKDKIRSLKDIHSGYTNYSYIVTFNDESQYQIRIPHCGNLINRKNEAAILKLTKDENFIYFDEKTGIAVKKWIPGGCPIIPKFFRWPSIYKLFDQIKELHQLEVPKDIKFHKLSCDEYNEHLHHLKFEYQKKYLCLIDRHRDDKLCINHTDINAQNIIIGNNKSLHLIDYEWAGLAPDYWDYANFIRESGIRYYQKLDWKKYIVHFDMQKLKDYIFMASIYAYLWTWAMPQSKKIIKYRAKVLIAIRRYYKGVQTHEQEYCNKK